MRTILKVTIPVEAGNKSLTDGRLQRIVESTMQSLKPEAAYFYPEGGKRHAMFVFDMKSSSDMPGIAEPFFQELNADVVLSPCMNPADLAAGLKK